MEKIQLIFKHVWIIFIAVTIINGLVIKHRSKKCIAQNPELEEGYNKLFKGLIIYGNIPWVIIMIGNLCGITQSFLNTFNPKL